MNARSTDSAAFDPAPDAEAPFPRVVSRRELTKAIAWGAPVVALAVATPAAAASHHEEPESILNVVTSPGGVPSGGTIVLTGETAQLVMFSVARTDGGGLGFLTTSVSRMETVGQFSASPGPSIPPTVFVTFTRTDSTVRAEGTVTLTISSSIPPAFSEPHVFFVEWEAAAPP